MCFLKTVSRIFRNIYYTLRKYQLQQSIKKLDKNEEKLDHELMNVSKKEKIQVLYSSYSKYLLFKIIDIVRVLKNLMH